MICPCEKSIDVEIRPGESMPCPECKRSIKYVKTRSKIKVAFANMDDAISEQEAQQSKIPKKDWVVVQGGTTKIEWFGYKDKWLGWDKTEFTTGEIWRITYINQIARECYCPQCDKLMFINTTIRSANLGQDHKCRNNKCKANVQFHFDIRVPG